MWVSPTGVRVTLAHLLAGTQFTGDHDIAAEDAIVGFPANPPKKERHNYAPHMTVVASNRASDTLRRRSADQRRGL